MKNTVMIAWLAVIIVLFAANTVFAIVTGSHFNTWASGFMASYLSSIFIDMVRRKS